MTDTMTGMLTEEEFLAHVGATPDMTKDEFLEHFGVKGMKWGKRSASSGGSSDEAGGGGRRPKLTADGRVAKSRKELRTLDKATASRDKATAKAEAEKLRKEADAEIDAARARNKSGENKQALKDAKAQYKSDKLVIGKREAKKAVDAVRDKKAVDEAVGAMAKSGRETVVATIGAVAATVILAAALQQ